MEQKAREYGLEDVRYIPLQYDSKSWSAHLDERAVAAEADTAGAWYYATVSLEDVTSYLESAAEAGVVTIGKKAAPAAKATAKSKGKGQ